MKSVTRRSTLYPLSGFIASLLCMGCQNNSTSVKSTGDAATGDVAKNQELARRQTEEAFQQLSKSHFDSAEELLTKAMTADPLYGPAHNDMGLVHFHRQDWYNAAWEFENAQRLMPRQSAPVNNLGLVLEKADKLAEAEKSYQNALDLEPDNSEYAGNLARTRIKLGLRDEKTKKLLDLIILCDRRSEWVAWAREQASRMASTQPAQ